MHYRLIFLLTVSVFLFSACGGDSPSDTNAEAVGSSEEQHVMTAGDNMDDLKANATKEGDTYGIAKRALGTLQSAYNASESKNAEQGKVTVLLSEDFTLIIKSDKAGNTTEQRVKLAQLSTDMKGYGWIVDNGENPFPGVKIPVVDGKPSVEVWKNGSRESTQSYLEIVLAERDMVQQAISNVIFAIQASKGEPLG